MDLETLRNALPDYARDLKLSLGAVCEDTSLNDQQKWGVFLACSFAAGEARTIRAISGESMRWLAPEAQQAAKAASAVMAMTNVYYRFAHLVHNEVYRTMPARLRMSAIGRPGIPKPDFELYCMAVSAMNGCGACMDAHEEELCKAGFRPEQIQAAVRISAVVSAVARTLQSEAAIS